MINHHHLSNLAKFSRENMRQIGPPPAEGQPELSKVLGHSGATVFPAIVKDGPFEAMEEEAVHLDYLGSDVAPKVYMFGQNSDGSGRIVMEHLAMVPEVDLLLLAIQTLDRKVWNRPPHPLWNRKGAITWAEQFYLRFGFEPPLWVGMEEHVCVHGDPTLANMAFDGIRLRFIDPKPPGNGIPPFASADLGKIMQSWMGWERALFAQSGRSVANSLDVMYTTNQVDPFENFPKMDLRRVSFWCMVHFLRIVHREGRSGLGFWAAKNVRALQGLIGMENDTVGLGPRWDAGGDQTGELSGLHLSRGKTARGL